MQSLGSNGTNTRSLYSSGGTSVVHHATIVALMLCICASSWQPFGPRREATGIAFGAASSCGTSIFGSSAEGQPMGHAVCFGNRYNFGSTPLSIPSEILFVRAAAL
eukprot:6491045-Amphidinium_carterae.1